MLFRSQLIYQESGKKFASVLISRVAAFLVADSEGAAGEEYPYPRQAEVASSGLLADEVFTGGLWPLWRKEACWGVMLSYIFCKRFAGGAPERIFLASQRSKEKCEPEGV